MSYCRWSSMGFQCDVYSYAHVNGGYTTHIATRRAKVPCPELDFTSEETIKATLPAYNEWLAQDKGDDDYTDLNLPYDGETFNDPTLQEFKARLIHLREVGYQFPDYVLERIDEEIAEELKEAENGRD